MAFNKIRNNRSSVSIVIHNENLGKPILQILIIQGTKTNPKNMKSFNLEVYTFYPFLRKVRIFK